MQEPAPLAIVVMEVDGRDCVVGTLDGGLRPDLGLVDDLLKFVLAAGRLGWAVRVRRPHPHLRELIDLLGMTERLGLGDADDDGDDAARPSGSGSPDPPAVRSLLLHLDALG